MLLSKRLVVIYKDDVGNRTDAYNTGGQPNINSIDLTWQRWPPPTSVLRAFLAPPFCPYVLAWPQLPANLRDSTVISRNRYHRHCQHRWNHRPLNLNFLSFFLSFAMRKSSKFLKFGTGEDDKGIHEDFYSVFIVRYNSRGMNWTLEYFKEDKNA